jgi:hypothetical protein
MTGSKRVDHWASGTVYECSEIADTPQGSPPAADYVSCQAGGGPAASVKPGQKSYVRSSGIITLSARGPSDGSGRGHNDQSRWGHQYRQTTLTGESRFHINTPPGVWTWVPHIGKQTVGPLGQWNCVWMQWDCRLLTMCSLLWSDFTPADLFYAT